MNTQCIGRMSTIVMLSFFSVLVSASITAHAGITTRVSVDSKGREGGEGSYSAAISADGRYVAFSSDASNLVPLDTNNTADIFVHDRQTGSITRVSVDSAGKQANSHSFAPALSADGRYVAFESLAWNLAPGDIYSTKGIFVHDRQTGSTTRVSVDSAGGQGNGDSEYSTLSADGRFVAFASRSWNLVPNDTNNASDIFVHDRETGTTRRVSVDRAGAQGNQDSAYPVVSANGRYVAFVSSASNLVPGDTNNGEDVFVHDRRTGATVRVSVDSAGRESSGGYESPALSADGRYVAFASSAWTLVPRHANDFTYDIFVHDRQTGRTTLASVNSAGEQGNNYSFAPALSADGRYVAFHSDASNLVSGETNRATDIFLHDRQTGSNTRISVDNANGQGNKDSFFSVLSPDGRYVAFTSDASNLVPGDTNRVADIFIRDRVGVLLEGPTGAATCSDGLDNDSDGYIDVADVDCAPVPPPLMCDGLRVTIVGTAGNDTIQGTSYDDVITGRAGDDVIDGVGGNDVVCGGNGNDTLNGWYGRDRLYGGPGDDALNGGNGVDKLHGGTGTDICDGQGGADAHLGGCETVLGIP